MNPIPRQKLIELVANPKYGMWLCEDAQLCRSLLNDVCGGQFKKEISGLVNAVVDRAASELAANRNGARQEVLIAKLSKRLQDNVGLEEELALWSVQTWALVLGITCVEDKEINESNVASLPKEMSLDLGAGVKLALAYIPPGKFLMGTNESGTGNTSKPAHKVRITKGFYIGKYPVMQSEFQAVMGTNPSFFKDKPDSAVRPVEQVLWDEAQAFCKKLSERTGKTIQLPTEAQWEYACRAGTTTNYHSGDSEADLARAGWYAAVASSNGYLDLTGCETHPVGTKESNRFGLYDMHGNVCEWCLDWCDGTFYKNQTMVDPLNADTGGDCVCRVVRGGSWHCASSLCRSSDRLSGPPKYRESFIGFRVVVSVCVR